MTTNAKVKILVTFLLIIFGIASRFLPHAWNFTPVTAIALFVSTYFGLRYSAVALAGMVFVSDIFLGFYHWPVMLAVYLSFAVAGFAGLLLKKKRTLGLVLLATLGSSLVFFVVTNWAVWQFGTMYPHSWSGLIQSYVMALPFFRNSLAGDIFYSVVLFGAYEVFLCKYYFRSVKILLTPSSSSGVFTSRVLKSPTTTLIL